MEYAATSRWSAWKITHKTQNLPLLVGTSLLSPIPRSEKSSLSESDGGFHLRSNSSSMLRNDETQRKSNESRKIKRKREYSMRTPKGKYKKTLSHRVIFCESFYTLDLVGKKKSDNPAFPVRDRSDRTRIIQFKFLLLFVHPIVNEYMIHWRQ